MNDISNIVIRSLRGGLNSSCTAFDFSSSAVSWAIRCGLRCVYSFAVFGRKADTREDLIFTSMATLHYAWRAISKTGLRFQFTSFKTSPRRIGPPAVQIRSTECRNPKEIRTQKSDQCAIYFMFGFRISFGFRERATWNSNFVNSRLYHCDFL